jgi:hypothetical protein
MHPYLYGSPIENLLYEYFDVDPVDLEWERRDAQISVCCGNG